MFRAREKRILGAVANRVLRSEDGAFEGIATETLLLRMETLLSGASDQEKRDLHRLLRLLEFVIPVFARRFPPFSKLAGEDQDIVLSFMMSGPLRPLRGAFDVLKSLCAMAYFQDPKTWKPLGYTGPVLGREHTLGTVDKRT